MLTAARRSIGLFAVLIVACGGASSNAIGADGGGPEGTGSCQALAAAIGPGDCPCQSGLYCDFNRNGCFEPVDVGGPCYQQDACKYPLVCGPGIGGGICARGGEQGEACEPGVGVPCARVLSCDPVSHTCLSPTLAEPGQSCTNPPGCKYACVSGAAAS